MAIIMAAVVVAGCGKASEGNALKDKLENVKEDVAEEKTGDKKSEKKTTKKKEKKKSTANLRYVIDGPGDAPCETIHVIDDDGTHAKLIEALDALNDDYVKAAYDTGSSETRQKIYVRRADDTVLSFAHDYREPDGEDDYVEMRGHSFVIDSGKELELDDVVTDEDAFKKLLADELHDVVTHDMTIYAGEEYTDDFDAEAVLDECMKKNRYGWVLDPQGVTFWFENVNAVIGRVCVSVLFSADEDGEIFNPEYAEVSDSWIMKVPGDYCRTVFDCDDNGKADTLSWSQNYNYDEECNEGIDITFNDRHFIADELCELNSCPWSHTEAYLMHKDKETVMVVHYYEEAESLWASFTLKNDFVEKGDIIYAYPEYENYAENASGKLVPTDMGAIRVYSDHGGDEITEYPDEILSVDTDGTMKVSEIADNKSSKKSSDESGKQSGKSSGLSREDAAEIADNLGGMVCVLERHDYDGDGADEAFVVLGSNDEYNGYLPDEIWFISSDGKTELMRDDFNGLSLYTENDGYYMEYADENKGFFYGDCGGYGSGWTTFVFSVKDGRPYELTISMNTEGFYQDKPGVFYTLTDNFDNGHAYLMTELIYSSRTGQFKKGEITDEDWLNR